MKIVKRHCYGKGNIIYKSRVLTFKPFKYNEINNVIELIQENLTPDFLKGLKKVMYPDDKNKVKYYGHCYHSSQALYHLIDTDKLNGFSAEDYRGEKHWWLQDDDKIYDVTAEQYFSVGEKPPYERGKKTKWYGWQERPQQISLNLMTKVLKDRLVKDETIIRE
tara:strand:+ start:74 stop:565 length:492 start_codon:yes stop_codon:yes gene_type:complete